MTSSFLFSLVEKYNWLHGSTHPPRRKYRRLRVCRAVSWGRLVCVLASLETPTENQSQPKEDPNPILFLFLFSGSPSNADQSRNRRWLAVSNNKGPAHRHMWLGLWIIKERKRGWEHASLLSSLSVRFDVAVIAHRLLRSNIATMLSGSCLHIGFDRKRRECFGVVSLLPLLL